jgi:hypothetical protein
VDVWNLLPESGRQYWPSWLELSIGYGGDVSGHRPDPNGPVDQLSQRRYVIGLDYNLLRILPDGGWFWNWMRQTLTYIKLPAPAIEFSPAGTKLYFLYPFKIKI